MTHVISSKTTDQALSRVKGKMENSKCLDPAKISQHMSEKYIAVLSAAAERWAKKELMCLQAEFRGKVEDRGLLDWKITLFHIFGLLS